MAKRNKRLGVYMDATLYEAIQRQAAVEDRDMSHIARRVLEDYARAQFLLRQEVYPGQQRMEMSEARRGGRRRG